MAGDRRRRESRIALMYLEWAGQYIQSIVMPWTLIDSQAALHLFADRLEKAPISRHRMTSVSSAISFSAEQFGRGFRGTRRVIDVSGDGPNNSGGPVEEARDAAVKMGVVINGLPVILKPDHRSGFFDIRARNIPDCVIAVRRLRRPVPRSRVRHPPAQAHPRIAVFRRLPHPLVIRTQPPLLDRSDLQIARARRL